MTPIAKKTKPSFISVDTLTAETILFIMITITLSSFLLEKYVHVKLQIFALPFIIGILAYLILPSNVNKGKNGAQRIVIMCKYYLDRIRDKYYANR